MALTGQRKLRTSRQQHLISGGDLLSEIQRVAAEHEQRRQQGIVQMGDIEDDGISKLSFGLEVELSQTFLQKFNFDHATKKWLAREGVLKSKIFSGTQEKHFSFTMDDNKGRYGLCIDPTKAVDGDELVQTGKVVEVGTDEEKAAEAKTAGLEGKGGKCNFGLVEIVSKPQEATAKNLAEHLKLLREYTTNFDKKASRETAVKFSTGPHFAVGSGTVAHTKDIQYSQGVLLSKIHEIPSKGMGKYGFFEDGLPMAITWSGQEPGVSNQLTKNFLALWRWAAEKYLHVDGEKIGKNVINPSPKINFCQAFHVLPTIGVKETDMVAARKHMKAFIDGLTKTAYPKYAEEYKKPKLMMVHNSKKEDAISTMTKKDCALISSDNTLITTSKSGENDAIVVFEFRAFIPSQPVFKVIETTLVGEHAQNRAEDHDDIKAAIAYMTLQA